MTNKTQISVIDTSAARPAHLNPEGTLGNENVSNDAIKVPYLKLLHDISNETKKKHPAYVEGAEPGMLIDSVSNEVMDSVYLINLKYNDKYVVWKKREFGGGKVGEFATLQEAEDHLKQEGLAPEQHDTQFTGEHYCMRVEPQTGRMTPIIVSLARSGLNFNADWNTAIAKIGGDRFSSVWEINSRVESGKKGDFYVMQAKNAGWAAKELYEKCLDVYNNEFAQ